MQFHITPFSGFLMGLLPLPAPLPTPSTTQMTKGDFDSLAILARGHAIVTKYSV